MADLILTEGMPAIEDEKSISRESKPKSGSFYHTEVECRNQLGEILFKKSNIILVGGRRLTLEKLFNVSAMPNQKATLNSIFGVNNVADNFAGPGPRREKAVCLFGVGRGGSNLTFGSVISPGSREYNLYDMLPLRQVNAATDIPVGVKQSYYMRVTDAANKVSYYLKRFEAAPTLVMRVGDQEYVPDPADNVPVDPATNVQRADVDVYVEMSLKISADDIREYYRATSGIQNARINELALYLGWQPEPATPGAWTDYRDVEAFSKLTFNNEPLDDDTKELNIVYRIYI